MFLHLIKHCSSWLPQRIVKGDRGRATGRKGGGRCTGSGITKVVGSGRQREQLRNIAQYFAIEKMQLRTFAQKTSTIQIFFILWLQSDNELPMSEMEKNWGVTDFVFEIKRVKNYPNFDKSALVTRHGLSAC